MGFTDIHTHILCGLDDGAQNDITMQKMAQSAKSDGTDTVIATPHCDGYLFDRQKADEVAKRITSLKVLVGCEILYRGECSVEAVERGDIPTLADSDFVLVEFGVNAPRSFIEDAVHRFTVSGYTPIIAHAERYTALDIDSIARLAMSGACIQLNVSSVMGKNGFLKKLYCGRLLKARLVHFIASDAHNTDTRPPRLLECYGYICKKYGERYARSLFIENANKITDKI